MFEEFKLWDLEFGTWDFGKFNQVYGIKFLNALSKVLNKVIFGFVKFNAM
jgi:hypothetical protein